MQKPEEKEKKPPNIAPSSLSSQDFSHKSFSCDKTILDMY
jgi:hypothetical protein